jgi:hypothetical protein
LTFCFSFAIISYIMPEGAPRPQKFEVGINLRGADSSRTPQSFEVRHSSEIDVPTVEFPPTPCGVKIKFREWPDRGKALILREGTFMSVHIRCKTCPAVKMDETLHANLTDEDLKAARVQLREDAAVVFLGGCSKLSDLGRKDPTNLPSKLRPNQ